MLLGSGALGVQVLDVDALAPALIPFAVPSVVPESSQVVSSGLIRSVWQFLSPSQET